jgi:hypothetical protein
MEPRIYIRQVRPVLQASRRRDDIKLHQEIQIMQNVYGANCSMDSAILISKSFTFSLNNILFTSISISKNAWNRRSAM